MSSTLVFVCAFILMQCSIQAMHKYKRWQFKKLKKIENCVSQCTNCVSNRIFSFSFLLTVWHRMFSIAKSSWLQIKYKLLSIDVAEQPIVWVKRIAFWRQMKRKRIKQEKKKREKQQQQKMTNRSNEWFNRNICYIFFVRLFALLSSCSCVVCFVHCVCVCVCVFHSLLILKNTKLSRSNENRLMF